MPRHSSIARPLAAVLLCTGLLAACAPAEKADDNPAPVTSASRPMSLSQLETATASDGGRAEFVESSITPFKDRIGRDTYAWGVSVKNTSTTDVLVYLGYDMIHTDAAGKETKGDSWDVNYLLPGQTVYQGNNTSGGVAPTKMTPSAREVRWIPLSALTAQGKSVGVELVNGGFERHAGEITARATFTSGTVDMPPPAVYLEVVFRDSEGKLLGGMWSSRYVSPTGPGPHEITASFDETDWLPGADESKSAVTVYIG